MIKITTKENKTIYDKFGIFIEEKIYNVSKDTFKVIEYIKNIKNEEIAITIKRNDEEKTISVKPLTSMMYSLDATFYVAPNTFFRNIAYGFWDSLSFSVSIIDNLKIFNFLMLCLN